METRKKRFVEHGTVGNTGNCYSCGQPGHLSWGCPRRFPEEAAWAAEEEATWVPGEGMAVAMAIHPRNPIVALL
jgi:hypothetical protein